MNRQVRIAALAVAALMLGGGGFVAGMTVGPTLAKTDAAASSAPAGGQAQRAGQGQIVTKGGLAGGAAGAAAQQVSGRVLSVQDGSITVEVRQPGGGTSRSTIALVGANTRVARVTETDIKLGDIKPGDQVLIGGTTDQTTGTVSATSVIVGFNSLQQLFGGGQGGPGGAQSTRPSGSPGIRPVPSASARP